MLQKLILTAEKITAFENARIPEVTFVCHEFYVASVLEEIPQIRCSWYFNYIGHEFCSRVVSNHSVSLPSPFHCVEFSDTNSLDLFIFSVKRKD